MAALQAWLAVRHSKLKRGLVAFWVLFSLICMVGFGTPTVLAARLAMKSVPSSPVVGSHSSASAMVLAARNSALAAHPSSSCGWNAWLTPDRQSTKMDWTVSITEHWSCGPAALLLIEFDFGDGTTSSYWCYANCFSGSHTFAHSYHGLGTFEVYDGTSGGDYPSGTVFVLP